MKPPSSPIHAASPTTHYTSEVPNISPHPILRCPVDVLNSIFETALAPNQQGFLLAATISHICHQWRIVALSNPFLWRYIQCSMLRRESTILAFWERMSRRNKGVPAIIEIRYMGWEESKPLKYCTMDAFSNIEFLAFRLWDTKDIAEIQDLTFSVPEGRIGMLELYFERRSTYFDWSWNALLGRFPTIKALALLGTPRLRIEPEATPLSKSNVSSSSGISLFQLEELQLIRSELWIEQPLVLPRLRNLRLRTSHYEDWLEKIFCPNLVVLNIDNATTEEGYLDFIRRHPSITSLDSEPWQTLEELSSVAPQLHHLGVLDKAPTASYDDFINPKETVWFPLLRTFTVWDNSNAFGMVQFEELVRARCLPHKHLKSLLHHSLKPLETLRIVYSPHLGDQRLRWRSSKLIKEARSVTRLDKETSMVEVSLSWI